MSTRTFAGVIAGLLFAVGGAVSQAHGSEMDEGTTITFAQPVEIPGQVLGPGSYYFVRVDSGNSPDVNLIQIFNSEHTKVICHDSDGDDGAAGRVRENRFDVCG